MRTGHIKSKSFAHVGLRFDASYHMSEGVESRRIVESSPYGCYRTQDVAEDIFIGPRARRYYVSNPANGIPFLSSSDILLADLENIKLASKKYMPANEMMLEKGWTLITRSGTIGNCAFANAKHAQKLASEHVIRLKPNNMLRAGAIFAFFASRYGHSLLTQGTFGGVIQHIEPPFVGSLPIPKFPEEFQKEVDELVQESARLREEATDALNQAVTHFNEFFVHRQLKPKNIDYISIEEIRSKYFRLDSQFQIGKKYHQPSKNGIPTISLNEIASAIFITGRGKRNYVDLNGVPFISSSDMLLANPVKYAKQISKNTKGIENLIISEGDILVSRSGSVGNLAFIGKELSGITASDHAMRLRINKDKMAPEYVFAYLNSQNGKEAIAYLPYGSVIITLGEEYLGDVLLPLLSKEQMEDIVSLVKTYADCTDKAIRAENKAITMVEEEIDKWKK